MALNGHPLNWILAKMPSRREEAHRRRRESALQTFIEERRPGLAALGEEEIDRRANAALAKLDQDEAMKAVEDLRAQWKVKSSKRDRRTE